MKKILIGIIVSISLGILAGVQAYYSAVAWIMFSLLYLVISLLYTIAALVSKNKKNTKIGFFMILFFLTFIFSFNMADFFS